MEEVVNNYIQHTSEVSALNYQGRIARIVDEDVLMQVARLQSNYHLRADDILPRNHFLKQLQRERSRTDRSKAPLSIALFSPDSDRTDVDELVEVLNSSKRETDILGYLGDNRFAILLPDTNEHGARRLAEKVVDRANDFPFSTVTRTYPDQLFDNLITEKQGLPDFYPFFLDHGKDRNAGEYLLKRSLDILGALAGILLLSPLMLAVAAVVALSSPGPVIFRQIRLGKGGVPFAFYKFRSMVCNGDDRIHREFVANLINGNLEGINQGDSANPLYKLKSDPRVTRVGRIIRKTSLDELPQLFNVLKGDMSLVGPRPPVPYEVEKYQSWHLRRLLEVRPGITGLWQVEGRSKTSFDDMVRLDLRYTRSCSLVFDLKILLKTVKVVLRCEGAK